MRKILAAISLMALATVQGMAAVRTFVSALNGSDVNLCTRTAPCRTFTAAMTQTDANGELVVLDSGGYSPFTIDQGLSLIAPTGIHAAIAPTSGIGILINATGARVKIRGVSLNGLGAEDGIVVNSLDSLHLDKVSVHGFTDNGLQYVAPGHFFVRDSTFRANNVGIRMNAVAALTAAIDNVVFEQNAAIGLSMGLNCEAVVRNSIAVRNHQGYTCSGGPSRLTLENSVAAHGVGINNAGVLTSNACRARVSNCTLVNMIHGLQNVGTNSAMIHSAGNNTIEDAALTGTIGTYTRR